MSRITAERLRSNDEGFGLVEIVVSMFMLALLAMAFLPILVQGLKQSSSNATLATGTQLVNQQLQKAQANGPTCTNVESVAGTQQLTDPQGVQIQVTTTVGACPAGTGTVSVASSAVRQDSGDTVASASTLVYVK